MLPNLRSWHPLRRGGTCLRTTLSGPAQLYFYIVCSLKPVIRILRQAGLNNVFERGRRQRLNRRYRLGLRSQDGGNRARCGFTLEGALPGDHFVQERAEREDIGAYVGFFAL